MKHFSIFCLTAVAFLFSLPTTWSQDSKDFRVEVAVFGTEQPLAYFETRGLKGVFCNTDQNQLYHYYVGHFATLSEAEAVCETVVAKGFSSAKVTDLELERIHCGTPCPYITPKTTYAEPVGLSVYTVYFTPGSSKVDLEGKNLIEKVGKFVLAHPDYVIHIAGHTDYQGQARANAEKAIARCRAVSRLFLSMGIRSNRLKNVAFGESVPYRPNKDGNTDNPDAMRLNRRAVIVVADSSGRVVDLGTIEQDTTPVQSNQTPARSASGVLTKGIGKH